MYGMTANQRIPSYLPKIWEQRTTDILSQKYFSPTL